MDPFHGKSSSIDRRSSLRRSLGLLNGGTQEEEEEYDLTAAVVSDGFRQSDPAPTPPPPQPPQSPSSTHAPPSEPELQSEPQLQPPPAVAQASSKNAPSLADRPSSTSKPPRRHDSLTLRNDGQSMAPAQRSSLDAPQIRPQSPYRGPSNPSHPYQLYPQRTLSNATNSTAAPIARHSYDGPHGPTHPYTLYTQNIVPNGDEPPEQHIPVGFTGAGDSYRRQLGPDGEEAGDLIGPLGHTEVLPPYTRYPNEAYAANAANATPDANQDASPADAPQPPIADGAGGIGVATRNPEFSSTEEDLQLSRSRPSTASQHDINTAARVAAEKPPMSKWQRRAKKKLWGVVPYWAICLLAVGLVLMGVIMGAVLGTILSRHKPPPPTATKSPTVTVTPSPTATVDVVPLPQIPSGLPPLATGAYTLPRLTVSQAPTACFNNTTQSQAWSCNMPYSFYSIDLGPSSHAPPTHLYDLSIVPVNSSDSKFLWGTQPPDTAHPLTLTLVNDTFALSRGPAWWLKLTYDKTVIVPSAGLSQSPNSKRWYGSDDPVTGLEVIQAAKRANNLGAIDGDTPWVCTWPDTTLEIFIYPSVNSSLQQTATPTVSSQAPTPSGESPYPQDPPPLFPQVVKLLERRVSQNNANVYCRQIRIIDDGQSFENVTDSSGQPVEIQIVQSTSSWQEQLVQYRRNQHQDNRALVARDAYELTQCGCLWWSS